MQSKDFSPHHLEGSTAKTNPVAKDPVNPPVTRIDKGPGGPVFAREPRKR